MAARGDRGVSAHACLILVSRFDALCLMLRGRWLLREPLEVVLLRTADAPPDWSPWVVEQEEEWEVVSSVGIDVSGSEVLGSRENGP